MRKEYFIGDRHKYGVTLMETIRLEERLPGREIYKVKWTSLTDYKGINTQVFPMVRTNGEFYDFSPITKVECNAMLAIIKHVCEELQPLLVVKRQIDAKICNAHEEVWEIAGKNDNEVQTSNLELSDADIREALDDIRKARLQSCQQRAAHSRHKRRKSYA